jgi:hydrogenase maturation protease
MPAPFLVLAIGNESRGDDAIAPLLSRKLEAWLIHQNTAKQFEFLEDFQLQVEHATDFVGRELILFIDAGLDTLAPYTFYRVQANQQRTLFSHAITPEATLSTYLKVYQQPPPPAFVMCIRGEKFELGEPLSAAAVHRMELAREFVQTLINDPREFFWQACSASAR